MTEEISPQLFEHLVELAALELDPEEAEYLRAQLNNQLKAIQELSAIPVDASTAVVSHGVSYVPGMSAPLRPDDVHSEEDPARLLDTAPEKEDGFIVVPEIPHEDLA
jgi:aspartyl-tRNA(Asn)/glutamyl-tRNA(Gln) amidotransferase subunit C